MAENENRLVITVLVNDRVGVLRDVTQAVAGFQGNIDAFRQSIVAGLFSLVLTVSFRNPPAMKELDLSLRKCLKLKPGEPALLILPYRASILPVPDGSRYIAMIRGKDRPGLLFHISVFLSERKINIEDWQVEFDGDNVIHIGQVTVPSNADTRAIQDDFRDLLADVGLSASLCHEDIFRATNEIHGLEGLLFAEDDHD